MAGSIAASGAQLNALTPRPTQSIFGDNYLNIAANDFNFASQWLPEVYEKEVERYGNRTVGGFLRMVGAEMPMASDEVVWSEQGRIHVAFDDVIAKASTGIATSTFTFSSTANAALVRAGDTCVVAKGTFTFKGYVSLVSGADVTILPYAAAHVTNLSGNTIANEDTVKVFVYGTEYDKGSTMNATNHAHRSIEASFTSFSNKPIIMRDRYVVSGSDTAQIGWVEVATEAGTGGYLWYLKSEHEARLRFEDQMEMAMIEAEKSDSSSHIHDASGVSGGASVGSTGTTVGTEGLFSAIESRGLVFNDQTFGAAPSAATGIAEFDAILKELDKQGSIEENMLFLKRDCSLSIDNMLAQQNSYGAGGTSYGVFDNDESMALNLGFSGFRRGSYDFYKTDWKYLNDSTTRGLINDIEGVIVPAGTSTVYDQNMGKNIARPFLHVRYRASEADDRRMKSWITGSVGGNYTSDEDAMNVNFLTERCLCVQAANNFVLLKNTV